MAVRLNIEFGIMIFYPSSLWGLLFDLCWRNEWKFNEIHGSFPVVSRRSNQVIGTS